MVDEAKRRAQEALYAAIQSQAETNMKAALSATDKAALMRDLAEAYRLTAGGTVPAGTGRRDKPSGGTSRARKSTDASVRPRRRESRAADD
jgi:L-lactate utilization protein LutC